jgi:hypothetical protein
MQNRCNNRKSSTSIPCPSTDEQTKLGRENFVKIAAASFLLLASPIPDHPNSKRSRYVEGFAWAIAKQLMTSAAANHFVVASHQIWPCFAAMMANFSSPHRQQ